MIKLNAYAKLNLALDITGTLPGGMHALDMTMQTVSLHDEIILRKSDTLDFTCENSTLPEKNTLTQAARLFFAHTRIRGGAGIRITKNIPAQAGLGGGSADGAAVLLGLDRLYGTALDTETLRELALKIGADVPFFIEGGCARARGVGEILNPIDNKCDFSYLLIKPEGGISTPQSYRLYDEMGSAPIDVPAVIAALEVGDAHGYYSLAQNALMPAGIALCPEVADIVAQCKNLGADFSMMTGSGSCVFAVFSDAGTQKKAQDALGKLYPFCLPAKNVACGVEIL